MTTTRRDGLIAKLERIHATSLAEDRDLSALEVAEWNTIKGQLQLERTQPAGNLRSLAAPAIVTKQRSYSVARAIGYCLGDANAGDCGLEKEIHVHLSKGRPDAHGVLVPIAAVLKAGQDTITAGPPSVGSVLAQTDRLLDALLSDAEAALRRSTIMGPLGVTVVAVPDAAKIRVPRKIRGGAASWIARDGNAPAAQDLQFDDVDAEAHSLAVQARLNRSSLIYTSPAMEGIVRSDLSAAVADGLNDSYLNADGTSNAPVGLVTALTDASPTRDITGKLAGTAPLRDFLDFVSDNVSSYAEAEEGRKWLLNPATVAYLLTTPAWQTVNGDTATTAISDGKTLANLPVVQSYRAETSGTEYCVVGDFASTYMFSFGPSIDLSANPYHDDVWASGGVLIRGILDADFLFRDVKRLAMASDVAA